MKQKDVGTEYFSCDEVAHIFDRDRSELRDVTKRIENLESVEISNSLQMYCLPDDADETNEQTKLKCVSDIYNVAYPNGSLQGDALIYIKQLVNSDRTPPDGAS